MAASKQDKILRLKGDDLTPAQLDKTIQARIIPGTTVLQQKQQYIALLRDFLTSPAISTEFKQELITYYRLSSEHLLKQQRYPLLTPVDHETASMRAVYELLSEAKTAPKEDDLSVTSLSMSYELTLINID